MGYARRLPWTSGGGLICATVLCAGLLLPAGCPLGTAPESSRTPPEADEPQSPDDGSEAPSPPAPATPDGEPGCIGCHSLTQGTRRAVVDASGSDGHSAGLTDAICSLCHDLSRHGEGRVRLWRDWLGQGSVLVLPGDPARDTQTADTLTVFCLGCHGNSGYDVHRTGGSWEPACATCHDLHSPGNANAALVRATIFDPILAAERPVVFTARTGAGSFSDGDDSADGICQVCHGATSYHRNDGSGWPHMEGQDCTVCHAHATGFLADGSTCIACHSQPQGNRPHVVNADGSGGHHLGGGRLSDADCLVCHDQSRHMRGTVRVWSDPANRAAPIAATGDPAQLTPLCLGCHDGADHPTIHVTGSAWQPACTACHELHDPANANLSLVSDMVHNETLSADRPVRFTARTGAGSFSDGSDDAICRVCHTTTDFHRYDGGAPHMEGEDCTVCHAHAAGFHADLVDSCLTCHSIAQGARRAVVGEFALASHHGPGAAVSATDCLMCHDNSRHRQGHVRLWNVDAPDDADAVTSLDGDPLSDPVEAAKLELFCLACHDDDAAAGAVPFSDGRLPTPIDAGRWGNAAHGAGQMTCLGDGQTFGCHGNGHGSVKSGLLAPWDGETSPPPPGDPLREEEGLCFSCHDADGPASSNIEAQFGLASRHNVSAVDQQDGSRVECTDCHDPHAASAAAPLIDPGSGATWAGSGEGFCLTCHGGAPPAQVLFPSSPPGSGYDKSAFVGTVHDLETGDNSCRHCHRYHGSPHVALLRAKYVVDDYNEYTLGDGDYAACWLCHNEDVVVFGSNAFGQRHQRHVRNEDAPCGACHDAHAGFDAGEPGLINLDNAVRMDYDMEFMDGYDGATSFWIEPLSDRGNCYIRCHGEDHDPKDYSRQDTLTSFCWNCH